MLYPNKVQTCILLNDRFGGLEAIVREVRDVFQSQAGIDFTVPEARQGYFYHLFGQQDDLMITLEYVEDFADVAVFEQALNSQVTELFCPDIRQRLATHKSHILITLWHGVLGGVGDDPKIAAMFEAIGRAPDGATVGQFNNRLNALRLISHIVCSTAPATAVHWTQSNQLFSAEMFVDLVTKSAGIPIAVHPQLYGYHTDTQGRHKLGIKSFGVAHFLGREVFIKPNVIPWHANYGAICMFLETALMRDGVVTANDFVMAPEDKSFGYQCIHHDEPDEGGAPEYELVPAWYKEFDFVTDDTDQHPFLASIGINVEPIAPIAIPAAPPPAPSIAPRPIPRFVRPTQFGRKQV